MTIAILFDAVRGNGGSYQMSINNLLTLVKNFKKKKIKFVVLTHKKEFNLDQLKIKYQIIKISTWDFFFIFLKKISIFENFFNKSYLKSEFEKKLLKKKINLLIFLFTSWKSFLLKKISFTATAFDTCHIDFKGKKKFREISLGVFLLREYLNKKILPKAYRIIAESKDLKKKIINLYKLNPNSIIVIPNLPSIFLRKKINIKKINKKFNYLKNFYFYPAQYWEHKNHKIILDAVKKLKSKKRNINFVFCGKDKGNLKYIYKKIHEYGIEENIKIYNYLKDEELLVLYKRCKAMIMPSFFGPTNIPPVEAWFLGVAVGYSSLNRNHGKDAAIYFNPESTNQLIRVILKLEINNVRKKLIKIGKRRIKEIKFENNYNQKKFASDIKKFTATKLINSYACRNTVYEN
jgi:glycosyltransferase involved in cell wall biosynthesis